MKKNFNSISCDLEKNFNFSFFDKAEILDEDIKFLPFKKIDLIDFSIFDIAEILNKNESFFIFTDEKAYSNEDIFDEINIETSRAENTIKDIYQKIEISTEQKIEVKNCGRFFFKKFK